MADAFEHCERLVREGDKDRFLAALFASPERRPLLYALYAFDIEIAAIALKITEPMAGEVRLQWWREVIEGGRGNEAAASPVAAALCATITAAALDRGCLVDALDARSREFDPTGIATTSEFERYALGATGSIMRAGAQVLGVRGGPEFDDLVAHASVAAAATAALRHFALRASRGRTMVPAEILDRHGVGLADVSVGRTTPALKSALLEFAGIAARHAGEAMAQLARALPQPGWPAFLHVGLAPLYLGRIERDAYDPFTTPLEVPQWRRQWRLWRLARLARP
jgi:15-cis-phytoene synthase